MTSKTAAMILQEFAIQTTSSPPVYNVIEQIQGTHENEFVYEVEVHGIVATGKGRSKKEAKQDTARNALAILAAKNIYKGPEVAASSAHFKPTEDDEELRPIVNYIGLLGDTCYMYKMPSPEYVEISAVGPPHAMVFTYEARIGRSMRARTTCSTKRTAKQEVAKDLYFRLKSIVGTTAEDQGTDMLQICDDSQIVALYREHSAYTNLGLKLSEYDQNLYTVLSEKGFTYGDIEPYLMEPWTEEQCNQFCEKMEFAYDYYIFDNASEEIVLTLNIQCEIPLSRFGFGVHEDDAKDMALQDMLSMLRELLTQ